MAFVFAFLAFAVAENCAVISSEKDFKLWWTVRGSNIDVRFSAVRLSFVRFPLHSHATLFGGGWGYQLSGGYVCACLGSVTGSAFSSRGHGSRWDERELVHQLKISFFLT
jgi:hypothetical protein